MKKTTKYTILGSAIGSVAGCLYGAATAPKTMASALVAPVSYPICSAALGFTISKGSGFNAKRTVIMTGVGLAIGIATIPLAPINFVTAPVAVPLMYGVVGTVVGGVTGYGNGKKASK